MKLMEVFQIFDADIELATSQTVKVHRSLLCMLALRKMNIGKRPMHIQHARRSVIDQGKSSQNPVESILVLYSHRQSQCLHDPCPTA